MADSLTRPFTAFVSFFLCISSAEHLVIFSKTSSTRPYYCHIFYGTPQPKDAPPPDVTSVTTYTLHDPTLHLYNVADA